MFGNSENLNNQAIEFAKQGFYNEALLCLERALVSDKKNYLLWYNLGITYRDCGKLADAKSSLMHAYELNNADQDLLESLTMVCFSLGDTDNAFRFCYECLDLNPMNAHEWNNLGVIFFSLQNYDEACDSFETAVSISPYYYDALFNLRDTYTELGNTKGAKECSSKMKELKKGNC